MIFAFTAADALPNISKYSLVQLILNKEHYHSFCHTTCHCLLINGIDIQLWIQHSAVQLQ